MERKSDNIDRNYTELNPQKIKDREPEDIQTFYNIEKEQEIRLPPLLVRFKETSFFWIFQEILYNDSVLLTCYKNRKEDGVYSGTSTIVLLHHSIGSNKSFSDLFNEIFVLVSKCVAACPVSSVISAMLIRSCETLSFCHVVIIVFVVAAAVETSR